MPAYLCIDIGNTQICIALIRGEEVLSEYHIPSAPPCPPAEYTAGIRRVLSSLPPEHREIRGAVISSVVPRLTRPLRDAVKAVLQKTALIVDHRLPLGLKIRYEDPSEVGADRICNAAAALKRYPAPLIIVDMGTATTFDVISEHKEYLGGVIMPGLETAGRDLFRRAARLPEVNFDFPAKVIGTRTRESLQAGLMWGTIDQIDGMIQRICKEWHKEQVTVVATGGLSEVIAPRSRYIRHVDRSLTLFGMKYIFEEVSGERT
jgi:type III pantothenate kinase